MLNHLSLNLLVFLLSACGAYAQYGRGTILGTVTDTTGTVAPGVKVTARNAATNDTREFVSDEAGNHQFNALLSGRYVVSAAGAQFKTTTASDVELRVNTQARVDLAIQIGAVPETVQVQSGVDHQLSAKRMQW